MERRRVATADDTETPPDARRPRSSFLDRTVQILDHLQATGRPATAYDIARSIGAPVSSIYAIIGELAEKRLLARSGANEVWLGPRLYGYGLAYAHSLDLLGAATEAMRELARATGETVQVCGRDEDSMVVLAMAEGGGAFRVTSRVGTRVPLNWTASGRLLVGHLPRAERVALFRRLAQPSPTGRAETDPERLADGAAAALRERLSIQVGESDFAVACIAAPVCDAEGACLATISIVMPEEKARGDRARYADAVRAAAHTIEERMGHRPLA